MKIRLLCRREKERQYMEELRRGDVVFADPADLLLMEPEFHLDVLKVRDARGMHLVKIDEIRYVESLDNQIYVHAKSGVFTMKDTLYHLEAVLYPAGFLRVHKSFIVSRAHIRSIHASLNMKFTLVLDNGEKLEVSRSYYYRFKEEIGF